MEKECVICKRKKDLEEFYKQNKSKDGHGQKCITCSGILRNEKKLGNIDAKSLVLAKVESKIEDKILLTASDTNPLSNFTSRMLIAELSRRGYHGELKFIQLIKV